MPVILSDMPTPAPGFILRPYRPSDLNALYRICLETGDTGEDATHLYSDPKLLGELYAAPYATYAPDLTFVLEDETGVCGYILGTLETEAFDGWLERTWFPPLRERYPIPTGNAKAWSRDEHVIRQFYEHRTPDEALLGAYPSHLHIDLLSRAQGSGNGRALMETFLDALRAKGSPGVHLGTSPQNVRAERFYLKMGFTELRRVEPHSLVMGQKLTESLAQR